MGTNNHQPTNAYDLYLGILAILVTISIYATNLVFSRFSVQHGLNAHDLTALRFLTAGLLLTPYLLKLGLKDLGGIGWKKGLILTLLAGSPYMWLLFTGLQFAPAAHAAVLNPGIVPAVVFIGSVFMGLSRFSHQRVFSFVLILIGLVLVTGTSALFESSILFGDLLLFLTGISWGIFTFLCRHWQLRPLQATTIVSVISMLFLPIYIVFFYQGFEQTSLGHVFAQAIYQGIFNAIIALYLLTFAVDKLGAQIASLFSPLIPVLATLMAVAFLNETPHFWQWVGTVLVVFGMLWAAKLSNRSN